MSHKISFDDGGHIWFDENMLTHREGDDPAVVNSDGSKSWYIKGTLHRENNPSFEDGKGRCVYSLNGIIYSEEKYWIHLLLMKY